MLGRCGCNCGRVELSILVGCVSNVGGGGEGDAEMVDGIVRRQDLIFCAYAYGSR